MTNGLAMAVGYYRYVFDWVSLIDSMDVVDVSSSREGEDICFRRLELNAKQQSTDDKGKCCIVHLR